MRRLISFRVRRAILTQILSVLALPCFLLTAKAPAQTAQSSAAPAPLITQAIDESKQVELKGSVNPAVQTAADQGPASPSLMLHRMILVLKRSDERQAALNKFLDGQKNPKSASYHRWLTPALFGQRFGAASQDIAKISGWLQSHGFTIESVAKGNNLITFSGTNAQLEAAFHTSIHQYKSAEPKTGVAPPATLMHYANASNPSIPAALTPVVAGIARLNSFPIQSQHTDLGVAKRSSGSDKWQLVSSVKPLPQFNTSDGTNSFFAVGPSDFAAIYNVQPLWDAGIDGTGQTIAIIGRSDINTADVDTFRSYFGLPAKNLNVIYNGPNPGLVGGDEGEADVDVEWSGAVAKNATIDYVVSGTTATTDGILLAGIYTVDNNLAPIMSVSFGGCERAQGTAGNQFFNELWEQAASQGITVLVASGDSGSAGCDQNQFAATFGLAVSGLASTPYNTAVGGTDLYGTYLNANAFWNSTNDPTTKQSVKGYLPELPWNNSCGSPQVLAALQAAGVKDSTEEALCNDSAENFGINTVGGSGGPSNCTVVSPTDSSCSGGYSKPTWQSGVPGIPADGVRDLPDVSLFAGSGLWGSFYVLCESDATPDGQCNFSSSGDALFLAAGGTSFASPAFAGIMALVNQKTNSIQGNANYDLYKLAAAQYTGSNASACDSSTIGNGNSCIFNDVSQGSNAVPCVATSTDCTVMSPGDFRGVLPGWNATVGFDTAVGLGTLNAYNLVNSWSTAKANLAATDTTLALDASTLPYGSPITGKITVTSSNDNSTSPDGDTSLVTAAGTTGVGLGPFTLASGQASILGNGVPVGTYSVAAHYGGDATFDASTSAATTLIITKAATNTMIVSSRTSVQSGQSDTFDVTVSTSSKALSPSGTVTFTDATTGATLGTFAVQPANDASGNSGAVAGVNITANALNAGNNNIVGVYSGDSNYSGSTAATITVNHTLPFSLSSSQPSIMVNSGSSATTSIMLSTNNGPLQGSVVLSCPTLPSGISCAFSPGIFDAGSSTGQSTLTINAAAFPMNGSAVRRVAATRNKRPGALGVTSGIAVSAMLALLIVPSKRHRYLSLVLCAGLLATSLISIGCGGNGGGRGGQALIATTTMLTATPTSGPQGTSFTFKSEIRGMSGSASPTGTVSFSDGNSVLGTGTLANGAASFSTTTLALGSHSVIATYSGDANFLPSASPSPATADVQYPTMLTVAATDNLGNSTTLQIAVVVQ